DNNYNDDEFGGETSDEISGGESGGSEG
nr:hypothetical protein [Tanacetum cinerariifolium]